MLEQAWQHYQGESGDRVVFLGVAYMDTENAARAYLGAHGVTFPNGPDLRGSISRIYQVSSVPETFILDADGLLRDRKIGPFSSLGEILAAVDGALNPPGN
jgi:cytochrome c biogenesis protein CcmG/thiol:disulfide interchange protein DsbE